MKGATSVLLGVKGLNDDMESVKQRATFSMEGNVFYDVLKGVTHLYMVHFTINQLML